MGKKIWYSSPLKFFWDELYKKQKKFTPEYSNEQIFSVLRYNLVNQPLREGESLVNRELVLGGLELWKEDSNGDFLHIFFLEKSLRDFLESTSLADLDGIKEHLYQNGNSKEIVYFKTRSKTNCVVYNFGLHIPYEKNGFAFSLSLFENNTLELYFDHGGRAGQLSDKFYNDLLKKKDAKSLTLCKTFRLAINTIAYMKCFPDCVTEGVPKITKPRNEERSDRNITFRSSEKIMDPEKTQISRIPHFRKGHFRRLQSDYFTNKKGQIVFVSETMVKGKARTVSTSERIEEFNNNAEEKSK